MADPIKTRVFLNSAEEAAYDREQLRNRDTGVKPDTRGDLLPIARDAEGKSVFAIPQWLRDTWNSIRLPSDVLKGYQPTPQENTDFAMTVGLGGMSASKIAGVEVDGSTLGMFLGRNAKNADTRQLAEAMSMEDRGQYTPEEIWLRTGWFKGLDDQWKWEIPDNNFDINRAGLQEAFDLSKTGSFRGPPEATSSAIKHDELFGNYPDTSNLPPPIDKPYVDPKTGSRVTPTTEFGLFTDDGISSLYRGGYTGGTQQDIVSHAVDLDRVRWVVAHELQHAVQDREGFASGSNEKAVMEFMNEVTNSLPENVNTYLEQVIKLKKAEDYLKATDEIDPKSPEGWQMIGDEGKDLIFSKQQEVKVLKDILPIMEKEMGDYLPEVKKIVSFLTRSPFQNYKRDAGEVEARLTQTRLDRDPGVNANTYPLSELDVPKEEVWTQKTLKDLVKTIVDKEQEAWEATVTSESKKGYEEGLNELLNTQQSYAKGGMVIDPVSGNEVPPGAKPEEVRDDINIKASVNEYIVPADVVRYIGLDKLERMVSKAKEDLAEMHKSGRIGGQEGAIEDDTLPFDPSELIAHTEDEGQMQSFAEGGQVMAEGGGATLPQQQGFTGTKKFKKGDQVIFIPYQNGQPFLPVPQGYSEVAEGAPSPTPDPNKATAPLQAPGMPQQRMGNGPSPNEGIAPSPLAGSPTKWSADNFIDYGKQKGSMDSKLIKGMISVLPGGAMALKAREKYLDSTVTQLFDTMMETGVDPLGNPITPEQKSMLSDTREKLKTQMSQSSGLNLNPIERLTDAFSQFQNFLGGKPLQKPQSFQPSGQAQGKPMSSLNTAGTNMVSGNNSSDNQYSGGNVSVGSGLGKQNNGPTNDSMRSGGLYSKGGLVARRRK